MTRRQTSLRPEQGGRFAKPVGPSAEVLAQIRAVDDRTYRERGGFGVVMAPASVEWEPWSVLAGFITTVVNGNRLFVKDTVWDAFRGADDRNLCGRRFCFGRCTTLEEAKAAAIEAARRA